MKYRRGRRGFWWWSWLLVLFVLAGVFGGRMLAEKKWAAMPKEYQANAILLVKTRPPYRAAAGSESVAGVAQSELGLVTAIRDRNALARVAERLDLPAKWDETGDEIIRRLRSGLETVSRSDNGEVGIRATMHSPENAQAVANTAAEVGSERIAEVMEKERGRALLALDEEMDIYQEQVASAREKVAAGLSKKGINVTLTPKTKVEELRIYFEDPNIQNLAMDWSRERERATGQESEQSSLRDYWNRTIPPPSIMRRAELPQRASGPDKAPLLRDGALYGLIAGLVAGLLVMFLCWKFLKRAQKP